MIVQLDPRQRQHPFIRHSAWLISFGIALFGLGIALVFMGVFAALGAHPSGPFTVGDATFVLFGVGTSIGGLLICVIGYLDRLLRITYRIMATLENESR